MARVLRILVCFLISALALLSVAYRVTWDDLLSAFFLYKPLPIIILLVYTFLIRVPPALRLQRLLPVSFPQAFRTIVLGCGLNNILPGRAGEIGRAHFLLREARIDIPRAARAIFWERLFDVNMLLLISCLAALFFHPATEATPAATEIHHTTDDALQSSGIHHATDATPHTQPRHPAAQPLPPIGEGHATETHPPRESDASSAVAADGLPSAESGTAGYAAARSHASIRFFRIPFLAGVLGIWVMLGLMYAYPALGRRAVGMIPFPSLRLTRALRLFGYRFLAHVRTDMTPRLVTGLSLTTLLVWAGYLGTTWITIRLVAGIPVPASAILLVFATSHLTYVMPAAPGSIGLYEWAWVYALGAYGVPVADAFAAGLTCHMLQYIPMTIFSIAILARSQMGLHLRELTDPAAVAMEDPPAQGDADPSGHPPCQFPET